MEHGDEGLLAVLNLPAQNKALIAYGKEGVDCHEWQRHFPNPTPTIAEIDATVATLDDAGIAVGGGTAKTKERNVARRALLLCLGHAKNHVQGVAEQQPSANFHAVAVITSAGMFVKKVTKPNKAELSARQGAISGQRAADRPGRSGHRDLLLAVEHGPADLDERGRHADGQDDDQRPHRGDDGLLPLPRAHPAAG